MTYVTVSDVIACPYCTCALLCVRGIERIFCLFSVYFWWNSRQFGEFIVVLWTVCVIRNVLYNSACKMKWLFNLITICSPLMYNARTHVTIGGIGWIGWAELIGWSDYHWLGLFHTDASIRSEHSRQTTGAYVYHCAFTLARVRALAEITRANVRVHSRCQRSARAFARVAEQGIGYF